MAVPKLTPPSFLSCLTGFLIAQTQPASAVPLGCSVLPPLVGELLSRGEERALWMPAQISIFLCGLPLTAPHSSPFPHHTACVHVWKCRCVCLTDEMPVSSSRLGTLESWEPVSPLLFWAVPSAGISPSLAVERVNELGAWRVLDSVFCPGDLGAGECDFYLAHF